MFISMRSIHGGSPVQTHSTVPHTGRVRGKQILNTRSGKDGHKEPVEDVTVWSESIEKLLESPAGLHAFTEFLKSEYSEENIMFWQACEEYKKISCRTEMTCEANRIYSEFVQTEAPRQINIDCKTRATISKKIAEPDMATFDLAQALIYRLMTRDSYPRFLKSDIYQGLLQK
ncbi:regulator of G-protein signaling 21 isoform X2 [Pangasianodon hypophthalmus]|uniref:regulator of G-protein signaling 21 isoform X2 n=1 Tax=Pangasianodon hypophthalmus TaxID=310915 RepID=UPI0023074FF9|nr:regulator of G-protein signaling 21 isoform X2 [Pangasianodon hypophthalmus]